MHARQPDRVTEARPRTCRRRRLGRPRRGPAHARQAARVTEVRPRACPQVRLGRPRSGPANYPRSARVVGVGARPARRAVTSAPRPTSPPPRVPRVVTRREKWPTGQGPQGPLLASRQDPPSAGRRDRPPRPSLSAEPGPRVVRRRTGRAVGSDRVRRTSEAHSENPRPTDQGDGAPVQAHGATPPRTRPRGQETVIHERTSRAVGPIRHGDAGASRAGRPSAWRGGPTAGRRRR